MARSSLYAGMVMLIEGHSAGSRHQRRPRPDQAQELEEHGIADVCVERDAEAERS